MSTEQAGELIRTATGQYIEGTSGNPMGRPKGSKNRITLLKMASEEAWRERNQAKLDIVLDLILTDAMEGDKAARKMIFEAVISKANVQEDKAAGHKQQITVHRMVIENKGENVNVTQETEEEEDHVT